jgi:hypothetical protein
LKKKEKKLVIKIISDAQRTYNCRLVKFLRGQKNAFEKFKDLTQEDL